MHRKHDSFECAHVAKSMQIRFYRLPRKTNRKPPVYSYSIGVLGLYKHDRQSSGVDCPGKLFYNVKRLAKN